MQPQPTYKIQEIFYTLQGEGANMGKPFVFVRFAGCNLHCSFCDTPNPPGMEKTASQILSEAHKCDNGSRSVLFTGGEPTLQLTDELVDLFKRDGWWVALETNGTLPIARGIDYVTVSPKYAPLYEGLGHVQEVRVALKKGQPAPSEIMDHISADVYYLSPIFNGLHMVKENIDWVVEECKRRPEWRVSIQIHKLIGVR